MIARAFMWAYNELDIIRWTVGHLLWNGIQVHVIDNWSTDGTYEFVREMQQVMQHPITKDLFGLPSVTVERWPAAAQPIAHWKHMLEYTEELALQARADGVTWVMHHDADEIRRSLTPGEKLLDALVRQDQEGWTAIDHEVEVYLPREGYDPELHNPETYFILRQPATHMDNCNGQVKCWKQPEERVDLASRGGHHVMFPGLRVSPEPFLLKHYPLRTDAQRARKLAERQARWAPEERAQGWHVQYDVE